MRQAAIRDPLIERFAAEMRRRLGDRLKEVILYGSRARGDADPDSDYDFLAVLDAIPMDAASTLDEIAADMLNEYDAVLSVLPVLVSRWQGVIRDPFFMNVRREGVTV